MPMLLQWTTCTVAHDDREAFGTAQLGWRSIRYADGLIAQIGGFGADEPENAGLITAWRDEASSDRFAAGLEGAVAARQPAELSHGVVRHRWPVLSRIPGQRPRFQEALSASRLLCVMRMRVPAEQQDAFLRAQLDVFTPGMAAAKGMYGGALAQAADGGFVVMSTWDREDHYGLFRDHHLPALNERAGSAVAEAEVATELFELETRWTINGVG